MIYIIITIYILLIFIILFPPTRKKIENIIYLSLGIVLFFIAAFRNGDNVRDYSVYETMYEQISYGYNITVEITFFWISKLCYIVFNNQIIFLFIIYALIGVLLKLTAIRQLTSLHLLSLIIYLANFFILHEMTQMRVGIAAGCLLLSIKSIKDRNWKYFLTLSCIGFLFHYSALIILPLWFLSNKSCSKWMLFLIPIAYIVYFTKYNLMELIYPFIPIKNIQSKIEGYQELQIIGDSVWNEINVFNMVFVGKIVIFYFLLLNRKVIQKHNQYFPILMKIFCISLFILPTFATIPVIAFRISELYGIIEIILIPFLVYAFKPPIISKSIILIIATTLLYVSIFYNPLIT